MCEEHEKGRGILGLNPASLLRDLGQVTSPVWTSAFSIQVIDLLAAGAQSLCQHLLGLSVPVWALLGPGLQSGLLPLSLREPSTPGGSEGAGMGRCPGLAFF